MGEVELICCVMQRRKNYILMEFCKTCLTTFTSAMRTGQARHFFFMISSWELFVSSFIFYNSNILYLILKLIPSFHIKRRFYHFLSPLPLQNLFALFWNIIKFILCTSFTWQFFLWVVHHEWFLGSAYRYLIRSERKDISRRQ